MEQPEKAARNRRKIWELRKSMSTQTKGGVRSRREKCEKDRCRRRRRSSGGRGCRPGRSTRRGWDAHQKPAGPWSEYLGKAGSHGERSGETAAEKGSLQETRLWGGWGAVGGEAIHSRELRKQGGGGQGMCTEGGGPQRKLAGEHGRCPTRLRGLQGRQLPPSLIPPGPKDGPGGGV